jgi:hypothetical protein
MTLTREEILAMEPGTELNALVAVKVMRWKLVEGNHSGRMFWEDENGKLHGVAYDFEPSKNISAALEVLEKPEIMDRRQIGIYPTSFGTWIARPFMPGGKDCTVQAKKAPEAISKCVLLAELNL